MHNDQGRPNDQRPIAVPLRNGIVALGRGTRSMLGNWALVLGHWPLVLGPSAAGSMIRPFLQDDAFLADVCEAGRDPRQLSIWWLGQSGFLVQWHGRHLLLDPYLSDSLTTKYA